MCTYLCIINRKYDCPCKIHKYLYLWMLCFKHSMFISPQNLCTYSSPYLEYIPLNLFVAFVSHFHWSLGLNIAFSEVRNQRGGDNSLWNSPSSTCNHMILYIDCLIICLLDLTLITDIQLMPINWMNGWTNEGRNLK